MKTTVNLEMTITEYELLKRVIKTSHTKTSRAFSSAIERTGFCERTAEQNTVIHGIKRELEVIEKVMKLFED